MNLNRTLVLRVYYIVISLLFYLIFCFNLPTDFEERQLSSDKGGKQYFDFHVNGCYAGVGLLCLEW